MEQMILSPISLPELESKIQAIVIDALLQNRKADIEEKLLSPSETCKLFQPAISKVTLTAWTNAGRMTRYDLGGRVYYRYSEVIEAAKSLKRYKRPGVTTAA